MAKDRVKVVTPPFRVSFPSVFEPSSFEGSKPKYSVSMVFDPSKFTAADKVAYKKMEAILDAAAMEKFKRKVTQLPANFKRAFRDGAEKANLDGYGEGKVFATASSKQQPGLIDRDKQPIISQDDFYAGCFARATVTAYAYDNKGKGVAFGLHNLQKLGDGESFSQRAAAEEDFGDDAGDVWNEEASGELAADDPMA